MPILDIPTDQPRQKVARYQGAFVAFALSANTCERVLAAARAQRVSLYNYLLTAFVLLLHRKRVNRNTSSVCRLLQRLTKEQAAYVRAAGQRTTAAAYLLTEAASFSELVQTNQRYSVCRFQAPASRIYRHSARSECGSQRRTFPNISVHVPTRQYASGEPDTKRCQRYTIIVGYQCISGGYFAKYAAYRWAHHRHFRIRRWVIQCGSYSAPGGAVERTA